MVSKINIANTNSTKPSIILAHDGSQPPKTAYTLLASFLSKDGYTVVTPPLPSTKSAPTAPDFASDILAVRAAVLGEIEKGNDVVLVMHSVGAIVGCEAIKWIPAVDELIVLENVLWKGSVVRLLFVAGSVMVREMRRWAEIGLPVKVPGWRITDNLIIPESPIQLFFTDPKELAEERASQLPCQSMSAFISPLAKPAYSHIPCSYLLCTNDKAEPARSQERTGGAAWTTRMESGHVAFVNPEKVGFVARWIREQIGESFAKL